MFRQDLIVYEILGFMWLLCLWELYLSLRQHRICITVVQVPSELKDIFPADVYENARLYEVDIIRFLMCKNLYNTVLQTLLVLMEFLPHSWVWADTIVNKFGFHQSEILRTALFVLILYTLYTLIKLPPDVYNTFVVEEKHGFNRQTLGFFVKDNVKLFVFLGATLISLSMVAAYLINIGGDYFFLYLWLFSTAALFCGLVVYPDFIAPLFDKFTSLPNEELITRVEQLAASVEFPLHRLYVVEGSKRSAHSNAYYYGFYKNKTIVLLDSLLKDYTPTGCDNDEVLGVLAHELGHWKLNHVLKNIILLEANLLISFLAFGMLFKYEALFCAFGFSNEQPVIARLYIVMFYALLPYNALINFCMTCLSRRYEFQADAFAKSVGKGAHLLSALVKLGKNNLSFPIYDRLFSMWHHSHPPLLERLRALRKAD